MVLLGRIELPTSSLPMTRSTTELQQPVPKERPYAKPSRCCQATCAARLHLPSRTAWRRMQRIKSGSKRSGFAKRFGQTCAAARQSLGQTLAAKPVYPKKRKSRSFTYAQEFVSSRHSRWNNQMPTRFALTILNRLWHTSKNEFRSLRTNSQVAQCALYRGDVAGR